MEPITQQSESPFCFCTAAYGAQYIELAKLLAHDLQKFAPNSKFLVVTNRPYAFANLPNVVVIKQNCRGVEPHHERRFAIHYGLTFSRTVIAIDADVRILAPVPPELNFEAGIAARSCGNLQKHMKRLEKPSIKNLKKKKVIDQMAQRAGIDIGSPKLKFINEFLFAVTKDQGREQEFLDLWGELAIYADTLGMHRHPTYAMAIAALKTGFPVYRDEMPGLEFFDDRIIRWNVQHKNFKLTSEMEALLQQQSDIEAGKHTLTNRVKRKLQKITSKNILIPFNRKRVQLLYAVSPSSLISYPK